ncbi:MAG: cyclic nucleotide-binding domain-containing protein [Chloroflexi bacterium]|nr:MAG: cyclic nucleotide-binding domain-containing protein [Chloroflexota bacterium]TMF19160.1 MAG: cyclic nucleotide-binding domain-containing protein [Chloroflexota bacterium]TMG19879.1 MAG: cyclic nucleotide-binding domain-containing protein [Chloroflexota bacterium]
MAVRDDVVNTIAAFSLFADLNGPQLEEVAHLFDETFFGEGERILRQGVSGSGFYIILEGTAAIRVNGVDRSSLKAGDYFGEISCLLGEVPIADIVAATPLRCLVLPGGQLEGFLTAHPKVMYRLLQGEARKLKNTTKWLS